MPLEVTDASFESDVLVRSDEVPVVVDLWAPWCGPCLALGPLIERVVEDTGGGVELAKVNVDENPRIVQSFQVQSIPAVFAIRDRQIVDRFIGALPEAELRSFVDRLLDPPSEVDELVELGDEESLRRALEIEPDHPRAIVTLAELLVARGEEADALALLGRIPESPEVRRVAALARLRQSGTTGVGDGAGVDARLDDLLTRVRNDDDARQQFVDLLETMDPADDRRERYRRALAARLF